MKVRFSNVNQSSDSTPSFSLEGSWLHEQGFPVGCRVAVCYKEHGRMTLINTDIESYRMLEEEFTEQVFIIEA